MLRSTRTIASLIRCLMLGTTWTVATATVSTVLVGCKDESQPDYWVDKLEDKAWRPRAIKRLELFYEDAVTDSGNNPDSPEVKKLLDTILVPLTTTYVENYDELDTKTRVSLIKLLSAFRDERTEPALKKAFGEFIKRPKTTKDEADIKWAARAAKDLKLASLADPMIQAFSKLKASTMLGGITYRDFNEAMVAMPQQSWAGPLKAALEPEIKQPKPKDADSVEAYRDQLFWQTTAAQVLGELQDTSAVEPLMKVILDPSKGSVAATALMALVKIGKPAVDAAVKLLQNKDKKLSEFHANRIKELTKAKEAPKGDPHVAIAASILGMIGRQEALDPMIKVLKTEGLSEDNKAVIARELTKITPTSASKQAFKEAFEGISIDTNIPPGQNALQVLAESASQFYDPSMIDWLLQMANKQGAGEQKKALQGTLVVTALKLVDAKQLTKVKAAVNRYGTKMEKDLYAQVEKLLKECSDNTSCYQKSIESSDSQTKKNQFVGIKAGYMLGILGDSKVRDSLIQGLDAIENPAVRFAAAQTIDRLTPKGSKDVAAELEKIIEKNLKSADKDRIAGDKPLKDVMYRIETRG